jgi:hypothetical protein
MLADTLSAGEEMQVVARSPFTGVPTCAKILAYAKTDSLQKIYNNYTGIYNSGA